MYNTRNNNTYITSSFNINVSDQIDDSNIINEQLFEDSDFDDLVKSSIYHNRSFEIAEVFHYLNNNNLAVDYDGKEIIWYEYKDNRWKKQKTSNIRLKLSENLTYFYEDLKIKLKHNKILVKKINNVISGLLETQEKNNIFTVVSDLFITYNTISDKLDVNNKKLICFDNGIFDIEKMEFRNSNQEDYISISTNYSYCKDPSEKYNDVVRFFNDIMPNENDREYLLKYLASSLYGINAYKQFNIYIGEGSNGKSMLKDLISNTFGDYYASFNSNILTSALPKPNEQSVYWSDFMKRKIMISSELDYIGIDNNAKINISLLKNLINRDDIKFRHLNSNETKILKPDFNMILMFNKLPKLPLNDKNFMSKCKILNFPVQFVDNPDPNNIYQKKKIYNINETMKTWSNDFMLLLLKYYEKYKNEGLQQTSNLLNNNIVRLDNMDYYKKYIDENLRKINEDIYINENLKYKHIHALHMFENFTEWLEKNSFITSSNYKIFVDNMKKNGLIYKQVRSFDKSNKGFEYIIFKD